MISFTRTAVAEIRKRLYGYLGQSAFGVKIATLDSHAWTIHSGHVHRAKLTGSYEQNIERVKELIRDNTEVAEELEDVEHLLVDEAQDIVGVRAELIRELVDRLPSDCGITVFADEAQAIYDFSEDGTESNEVKESLIAGLSHARSQGFERKRLDTVHRTESEGLKKIFAEVRSLLLPGRNSQIEQLLERVASEISDSADEKGWTSRDIRPQDFGSSDLLLYRSRVEVLHSSQFWTVPHSVRLSGYGGHLPSWLALCFYDFQATSLDEPTFLELWESRVEPRDIPEYGPDEAWRRLWRLAGDSDGIVDMRKLRKRLGQSRPPVDIATKEYGLPGAIIGTIHASKGREADRVTVMFPSNYKEDDPETDAEEARVLFVGATRARKWLAVGKGMRSIGNRLESGRGYRWIKNAAMVEVGREGDLEPEGLVGQNVLKKGEALHGQEHLQEMVGHAEELRLFADASQGWRFYISAVNDSLRIGLLEQNFNQDLWQILNMKSLADHMRPPMKVNHVKSLGCRTIVLPNDDPRLETLHAPWSKSGFMLAPCLVGMPPFYFAKRRSFQ